MNTTERLREHLDDVREFFLLREAEKKAGTLGDPLRDELSRELRLAEQRREAAELLHQHGSPAEALRLAREALAMLQPFTTRIDGVSKVPEELEAALDARKVVLDDEVVAGDDDLFQKVLDAHSSIDRDLQPLAMNEKGRMRRRIHRISVAAAVVVAFASLATWWARHTVITVEASAFWGARYAPEFAIDGLETTHWLLPDKTLGYLELKVTPMRKVNTVSILNGYDPPAYGVVDARVEAWVGTHIVKQQDVTFKGAGGVKPPWVDVSLATTQKIDKIRIVVKSHRDLGGAIAEVKID